MAIASQWKNHSFSHRQGILWNRSQAATSESDKVRVKKQTRQIDLKHGHGNNAFGPCACGSERQPAFRQGKTMLVVHMFGKSYQTMKADRITSQNFEPNTCQILKASKLHSGGEIMAWLWPHTHKKLLAALVLPVSLSAHGTTAAKVPVAAQCGAASWLFVLMCFYFCTLLVHIMFKIGQMILSHF